MAGKVIAWTKFTCFGQRAGVRTTVARSRGGGVGAGVGVAATTTGAGVGVTWTTTGSGVAGGGVAGTGVAMATTRGGSFGGAFLCQRKNPAAAPRAKNIRTHTRARPSCLLRRKPAWAVGCIFEFVFIGLPFLRFE